ncbi:MAG: SHOCT domain-containing protein [Chloroflexi bacterium]|nr:SHOCT domain-containing protein [Chloroflexota bacterium]
MMDQGMGQGMIDGGMMGGLMGVGMLIWAILALALVALVIVAIVWLVRQLGRDGQQRRSERSAIAELELRYARGEIEREAYLAVRRDLEATES